MALVLFFDGECGFCARSVRWVYRLDGKGIVDFAPLQGVLSKELGLEHFAVKDGGSMVVIREGDGKRFFKSDAWIELGKSLGGAWMLLASLLSLVPTGIRNWGYDFIARNRYRLAGKGEVCDMPEEGLKARMRE